MCWRVLGEGNKHPYYERVQCSLPYTHRVNLLDDA